MLQARSWVRSADPWSEIWHGIPAQCAKTQEEARVFGTHGNAWWQEGYSETNHERQKVLVTLKMSEEEETGTFISSLQVFFQSNLRGWRIFLFRLFFLFLGFLRTSRACFPGPEALSWALVCVVNESIGKAPVILPLSFGLCDSERFWTQTDAAVQELVRPRSQAWHWWWKLEKRPEISTSQGRFQRAF